MRLNERSGRAIQSYLAGKREAKAAAKAASQHFGVFGYTKSGGVYKTPSCTTETKAQAIEQAQTMEHLNPSKRYIVKPL